MNLTFTSTEHTEILAGGKVTHNVRLVADAGDGATANLHLSGLSDDAYKGLGLGTAHTLAPAAPPKPADAAKPAPAPAPAPKAAPTS